MWMSQHFLIQPPQFYTGIILVSMYIMLFESVIALPRDSSFAVTDLDKNDGMHPLQKRPAFFIGSRFGRSSSNYASGASVTVGSSKSRRLIIVPRNERFFLNSRYGKRNGKNISPYRKIKAIKCSSVTKSTVPCPLPCTLLGRNKYYGCLVNDLSSITHSLNWKVNAINKSMV